MHRIYHTEGIVLFSKNYGEDGRRFVILTRELGLVAAFARGVRKLSSKLRFVLQDFAFLRVDLIRTKDAWRLTSASRTEKLASLPRRENFVVLSNVSRLLRRLLAGEEKNDRLFDGLLSGLSALETSYTEEGRRSVELLIVLRALSELGYIGDRKELEGFIRSPFEDSLVFEAAEKRRSLLREVNRALRATHL